MLALIELTCPTCGREFASETLTMASTNRRKHTDFHPDVEGVHAMDYGIHQCPRCGFAGPEPWFAENLRIPAEVRQHVWEELTPRVARESILSCEKYECAAKVALWDGMPARQVGDLWLRAAWCAADENDVEAERYYRRHAAWSFEEALTAGDVVAGDRAVITYLVGELWRRIGDVAQANAWFDRVSAEIRNPHTQAWIADCARRQRDTPSEWFN
jgi:uncharacterized protein